MRLSGWGEGPICSDLPPELQTPGLASREEASDSATDDESAGGTENGWSGAVAGPAANYRAERGDSERRERDHLVRALAAANGNKAEAARALGVARSTLVSKLKKFGLS